MDVGKYVHTVRVFVTAEMARNFMRLNIANNRPIQEARMKDYARDMKHNNWKENGSTMVFSGPSLEDPGEMIDGQKRCMACIEAGVGFWTLIAFGVSKEAFLTIDRGQTRTAGQVLHLDSGVTDYNAVSATLSWLWRFRDGIMLTGGRPTSLEEAELLTMNPGLPESVRAARGILHRFKAGPVAIIAICHYLFTRQDATLAETFFDALSTGASLREIDPVYRLRERIIIASGSTSKRITSYELLALFFKTWNAEREQTTMKATLRWIQAESFPNIGPVDAIKKRPQLIDKSKSNTLGRRRRRQGLVVPVTPEKKEELKPTPEPPTKLDLLIQRHKGLDKR